jgi:membrane fusion protein (multidrug efflux system)
MAHGNLPMRTGSFIAIIMTGAIASHAWAEETAPRGIIRALNEAWLSSDLGFEILDLPLREGDSFAMGDRLVAFDCEALRAEAGAAEAKHDAEKLTYANTKKLAELKAAGRFEVGIAEARQKEAAAQVEAYRIRLSHCEILAPAACPSCASMPMKCLSACSRSSISSTLRRSRSMSSCPRPGSNG